MDAATTELELVYRISRAVTSPCALAERLQAVRHLMEGFSGIEQATIVMGDAGAPPRACWSCVPIVHDGATVGEVSAKLCTPPSQQRDPRRLLTIIAALIAAGASAAPGHGAASNASLEAQMMAFERAILIEAMTHAQGNQTQAARTLSTTPRILRLPPQEARLARGARAHTAALNLRHDSNITVGLVIHNMCQLVRRSLAGRSCSCC